MDAKFSEQLGALFPQGYWKKWEDRFQHDFWNCHFARTDDYDRDFIYRELSNKRILEVGGYPGLLMGVYKLRGCEVVAVDAPQYRPEYYLEWCKSQGIISLEHDIHKGRLVLPGRFDIAVMSDVLLHNSGFPSEFMRGLIEDCDEVYLLNYKDGAQGKIERGQICNLEVGFPLPSPENVIEEMKSLGAKISYQGESAGRTLLVFKKENQDEVSDSDSALRKVGELDEAISESGPVVADGA